MRKIPFIAAFLAGLAGVFNPVTNHAPQAMVSPRRRTRDRSPGKAKIAGNKLARMAAEGRIGIRAEGEYGRNLRNHLNKLAANKMAARSV